MLDGTPEGAAIDIFDDLTLQAPTREYFNWEDLHSKYREYLDSKGFRRIGAGRCADVYRLGGSVLVLKTVRIHGIKNSFYDLSDLIGDDEVVNEWVRTVLTPVWLPYVRTSHNRCTALQPYVDCSTQEAYTLLGCPKWNHPSNFGMYRGKPVCIDLD